MLSCSERIKLRWVAGQALDAARRQTQERINLALLHWSHAMDEEPAHHRLRDEQPELFQTLERINTRLDLLLELTARLLRAGADDWPELPVMLSATEIRFIPDCNETRPGQTGCLHLYLHAAAPDAVVLPGMISGEHRDDEGQYWLIFIPQGLSLSVQEALEQRVFRQHRRSIAEGRHGRSASSP